MREARAAAALRHPNVATVYQFGVREETGQFFYAMELVEAGALAAFSFAPERNKSPNPSGRLYLSSMDATRALRPQECDEGVASTRESDRFRRGQSGGGENERDGADARWIRQHAYVHQP